MLDFKSGCSSSTESLKAPREYWKHDTDVRHLQCFFLTQAAVMARHRAERDQRDRAEREVQERAEKERRERVERDKVERTQRERAERERSERELAAMQLYVPPAASKSRSPSADRAQEHWLQQQQLQQQQQQQARAPPPKAPPLKAPANIGSYANPPPKPPLHTPAPGPGGARKASVAPAGGAVSAPVSAAQTPASMRGAPLSAPVTPGSRPSPSAPAPGAAPTAWGTPTSTSAAAGASRIPSPSSRLPPSQQMQRQGSAAASPTSQADFDFLERASDSSDDDGGRMGVRHQSSGGFGDGFGGSGRRLQDSRPQALRIPGSGHSTPAAAGAAVPARQPASAPVLRVTAAALPPSHSRPTVAAASKGNRAATPFTQAIRELMGLPGGEKSGWKGSRWMKGRVCQVGRCVGRREGQVRCMPSSEA